MKGLRPNLLFLIFFAAPCAFLLGCKEGSSESFGRIDLFSIKYGRLDGEISLFSDAAGEAAAFPQVSLFMRDGLFYIGVAASKKILQFSSSGSLLSVYYNPEAAPQPDGSLVQSGSRAGAARQSVFQYPFNRISALAADSSGRLFVADALPPERAEYSREEDLMLENIVIRFDPSGAFLDYLGQEGPGGTPFSAIAGIYVNLSDELFVVSLKQTGAEVFWYSGEGRLLRKAPVLADALPSPYSEGEKGISVLSGLVPARRGGEIYVKIDYYIEETDAETGVQSGIAFDKSAICPFLIDEASFGGLAELPSFEIEEGALQAYPYGPVKIPYSMIGVTESEKVFLCAPTQEGYDLCIADLNSGSVRRHILEVAMQEKILNVFHLSESGVLSALLAGSEEASVACWMADSL